MANSIQLATAASLYSGLWFSKKESVDNVLELYMAVIMYSEKWKNDKEAKYHPKCWKAKPEKLRTREKLNKQPRKAALLTTSECGRKFVTDQLSTMNPREVMKLGHEVKVVALIRVRV